MSANLPPLGRLTMILGPMFAGKTTKLIALLRQAQTAGKTVAVCKPHIDDRYHATALATHDGQTLTGKAITEPAQLLDETAQVIGLDEAHFYRDGLVDAVRTMLGRGQELVIAGLDQPSVPHPKEGAFVHIMELMVEADEIFKIPSTCAICGRPAVYTARLIDSDADIIVAGAEAFEPRCRAHIFTKRATELHDHENQ